MTLCDHFFGSNYGKQVGIGLDKVLFIGDVENASLL